MTYSIVMALTLVIMVGGIVRTHGSFFTHVLDLLDPLGSVVQSHQIPASHVEAVQVIHCVLRVKDVLVHDECRPLLVSRLSLPDLPDRPKPSEHVVHFLAGDLVGQVPHEDDLVDLGSQSNWPPLVASTHSLIKYYMYKA